jgi:hypothetical protein
VQACVNLWTYETVVNLTPWKIPMTLRDLDRSQKDAELNVLCAAFYDYPVPRYLRKAFGVGLTNGG